MAETENRCRDYAIAYAAYLKNLNASVEEMKQGLTEEQRAYKVLDPERYKQMKEAGVTPEFITKVGEVSAESSPELTDYPDKIEGMTTEELEEELRTMNMDSLMATHEVWKQHLQYTEKEHLVEDSIDLPTPSSEDINTIMKDSILRMKVYYAQTTLNKKLDAE